MKKTSLIIALSAILPGIASAGAPVQYGQWATNATGGITLTGTGAGGYASYNVEFGSNNELIHTQAYNRAYSTSLLS